MQPTTAILTAAASLLLTASGCCSPAASLDMPGEMMPARTDEVVAAAQARCGKEITGTIEWRNTVAWRDPSLGGARTGYCMWNGSCPIDAWVTTAKALIANDLVRYVLLPDGTPSSRRCAWPDGDLADTAYCTALAHEIGHWCLQSEDEAAVEAWGQEVMRVALTRERTED